jgi:hypothetical protein
MTKFEPSWFALKCALPPFYASLIVSGVRMDGVDGCGGVS